MRKRIFVQENIVSTLINVPTWSTTRALMTELLKVVVAARVHVVIPEQEQRVVEAACNLPETLALVEELVGNGRAFSCRRGRACRFSCFPSTACPKGSSQSRLRRCFS